MAKQTSSTRSRYVQIRSRAWRRMVITVSAFLVVIIGLVSCKSLMPESDSSLDLSSSPGSGEFAGKIGVEASIEFVDRAKLLRQFERIGGGSFVPTDENGYPLTDAQTVIFDDRPIPAWAPPIDDPSEYQPDASGTYKLLFNGQATIGTIDGENINITNQNYDANTNTTIADVTLASNTPALMILTFTNTKRTPTHESNTGITNLKLIRPGYASDTTQLFTDRLLSAYQPFSFIRFMGVTNTNYDAGFYGDPGHHIIEWNERSLPSDASQQGFTGFREGKKGLAWEYLILLANTLNKDVWINIPVSASGVSPEDTNSYVYQLASLFKNGNEFTGNVGLKPELNIYLEHSNEVWNYSFSQYIWNKLAAEDEVAQGRSTLNNDGVTDPEVWARRRHAKRLYEVAKIFETVYGSGSLGEKIRPVYAHWTIFPEQYIETLTWMNNTYGTPGDYFWGLAQTHYFNDNLSGEQDAVQDVLRAMRTDSEGGNEITLRLHAIATNFSLHHLAYEAGPDNGGGDTTNIDNKITANREPSMKALVEHHIRDNWFAHEGELYSYFALSGLYSRYGCWGLTDDLANLNTEKFKAIYALIGTGDYSPSSELPAPLSPSAEGSNITLLAPTGLTATPGSGQVSLTWNRVEGATQYNVFSTTGGNFEQVTSGLTETRYTHTGLTNGTQYTYFVTASEGGNTSPASNPTSATPE